MFLLSGIVNSPFQEIFVPSPQLSLREATLRDMLFYDRARSKNLWVPALFQKLYFERQLHEKNIWWLNSQGFDFNDWAKGHRCYMSCYQVFGTFPNSLYRELFQPVKEVMDVVNGFCEQFSAHTIGLHIRRTDHTEAARRSPTYLFVEKVKAEIDIHADTRIFLATDSNEVKKEFKELFGQRVITPEEEARRDSISGIRGGLSDMWTLAATQKIYGSALSSFSPMAASIGGIQLEVIDSNLPA